MRLGVIARKSQVKKIGDTEGVLVQKVNRVDVCVRVCV